MLSAMSSTRYALGQDVDAADGLLDRRFEQLAKDACRRHSHSRRRPTISAPSAPRLTRAPSAAASVTIAPTGMHAGGVGGRRAARAARARQNRERRQGPGGQGDGQQRSQQRRKRLDDARQRRRGDAARDRAAERAPAERGDHDRHRREIGERHRERRPLHGDGEQQSGGEAGADRDAQSVQHDFRAVPRFEAVRERPDEPACPNSSRAREIAGAGLFVIGGALGARSRSSANDVRQQTEEARALDRLGEFALLARARPR